jgi:hypothetical protein
MQGKYEEASSFVELVSTGSSTHKEVYCLDQNRNKKQRRINPELVQVDQKRLTHWNGPSWEHDQLIPALNRRNEQLYIDTRNALCSLKNFRTHFKRARAKIAAGRDTADSLAEDLCKTWLITDGTDWVKWLLTNWDAEQTSCPPLSAQAVPDSFPPWALTLDYLTEAKNQNSVCHRATVTMHAGISRRDAYRLVDFILKNLNTLEVRGGRPRLTDREREMIVNEFERIGIPRPAKRTAMISKVQRNLVANGCRKIGTTAIGNELRKWLTTKGQVVRRYSA